MTSVAAVSTAATLAGTNTSSAQNALLPRLPSRIDFRSLMREDPEALGPGTTLLMTSMAAAAAPATPSLPFPGATAPGAIAKGSAPDGDDLARRAAAHDDDPLDPLARHHASLGPPDRLFSPPAPPLAQQVPLGQNPTPAAEVPIARAAASLEELFPQFVRRVAWSGDGRRGTMRLEIGAGSLAGSTLLVHSDGGRVRIQLDVPPGVDASGWQERIRQRLDARGIPTDSVEVT
jgi:hypothetical protein